MYRGWLPEIFPSTNSRLVDCFMMLGTLCDKANGSHPNCASNPGDSEGN